MEWSDSAPKDRGLCLPASLRSVLVVDDDACARELFASLVDMAGHPVRTADNGEEALVVAEAFCPDVIFMDIQMPKMNGYIACQRLRMFFRLQKTRIYAVSGVTGVIHDRRCCEVGFDGQVSKPADLNCLLRLI